MHYCNICIPFSSALFEGVWDPNPLIVKLFEVVKNEYLKSPRGQEVSKLGEISDKLSNHKKKEYEMGGLRFVVSACKSDRPAATLWFTPNNDAKERGVRKPIEMLHWYVAMGLNKQHPMQQVMLCRVRDFQLAQVVVRVIQTHLHIRHVSVRPLNKDTGDCEVMENLWARTWDHSSSENMPCLHSCGGDLAATAKSADTFLKCSSFLRSLTEHCSATNELLT